LIGGDMAKKKQIEFPFTEGKAVVSVGDKVFIRDEYSRKDGEEAFIREIGRKYLSLSWGMDTRILIKFHIDSGHSCNVAKSIYQSRKSYEDWYKKRKYSSKIVFWFRNYSSEITYEQAVAIGKIINIEEDDGKE
jgi:hypothetical protein